MAISVDGAAQLQAAVAAQRAQQVAGEALGMEADQHRLGRVDLADHDGEMLLAAVARPPGEDAGVLRALERHVRLRHLLQVARGGLLVGEHVGGIDIDQVLLARPVAPLVAGIAAERSQHDGGQQAGELGELDRGLGDARRVARHRPRQVSAGRHGGRPARRSGALVRPQDDVDRHALGQVERDRLVGLAHAAGDMRRDLHADRLGAAAGGDQDRRVLGQALQALQGAQAAGFGGDHQAARRRPRRAARRCRRGATRPWRARRRPVQWRCGRWT